MDTIHLIEELTGKAAQLHHKPRHPADVYATWACQVWLGSPH